MDRIASRPTAWMSSPPRGIYHFWQWDFSFMPPSIKNVCVLIAGYSQDANRTHGINRLVGRIWDHTADDYDWRVTDHKWDADFQKVASEIAKSCHYRQPDKLIVVAYSWGAGRGVPRLCRGLGRHNFDVTLLVLCDPIVCGGPLYMLWVWLTRWFYTARFTVPKNVRAGKVYFQELTRPMGNPVVRSNNNTTMFSPVRLFVSHEEMDDAPEFQDYVLETIAS